jgi:mono/diheme cytochrome c family protein
MTTPRLRTAVVGLAVALALAACGGGDEDGGAPPPATSSAGLQVWNEQACGSCHGLDAADSSGQVGPDLDKSLAGRSTEFIRRGIVEPDAEIAEGFPAGVMPDSFGERLSAEELQELVDFLAQSAGP